MEQPKTKSIEEKRKAFKAKIYEGGIVLPGANNALTAKQIQQLHIYMLRTNYIHKTKPSLLQHDDSCSRRQLPSTNSSGGCY